MLKIPTRNDIAAMLDVSVESINQASELLESGRDDLVDAVHRGDMELDEALERRWIPSSRMTSFCLVKMYQ